MKLLITFPELSISTKSNADDCKRAHHERYYFPDSEMVIFQVQECLYRVHRHFFIRESERFKSIFGDQEGYSDKKPINLAQVTRGEFEALLDFFYYGMFDIQNPVKSPHAVACSENERANDNRRILDLLSISLRYTFTNVIEEILVAIDIRGDKQIDPVPKILLALKHDELRHWLLPTFQDLVQRPKSLTKEEIEQLGPRKASIISGKREEVMRENNIHEEIFVTAPTGIMREIIDENVIPIIFFSD